MATSSSRSPSSGRRLRIAIVTAGRFHVVDLARELLALGHDVTLYSALPPARTRALGIPGEHARWLGPMVAGALLLGRRAMRTPLRELAATTVGEAVDRGAATRLEPCDVVIGMSGLCLRTLQKARRKYGAVTIVERSSQHIVAQRVRGRRNDDVADRGIEAHIRRRAQRRDDLALQRKADIMQYRKARHWASNDWMKKADLECGGSGPGKMAH